MCYNIIVYRSPKGSTLIAPQQADSNEPSSEMQRKFIVEEWLGLARIARAQGNILKACECEYRASEFWTVSEHASYLLQMIAFYVIIYDMEIEQFRTVHEAAIQLISNAYMARKSA